LEEGDDKRVLPVSDRGQRRARKRVGWVASDAGLRPAVDGAHAGYAAKRTGLET
jgi:hypothetical protein